MSATIMFVCLFFKNVVQKLYAWMQTILSTWPSQDSTDTSMSEDVLPGSADSGMTSLSQPLTPDTFSQTVSTLQDLDLDEQSCSLADVASREQLSGISRPLDIIKEYKLWLEMCIAALEKDASEEELLQVDQAVDSLARWEMFTGKLPAIRRHLPFARHSPGLRKVLGDTFSSLRRKLSSRRLTGVEASPCRWRWEES